MFRGAQFFVIALMGFFTTGCACTGGLGPHSRLWDGPVGWAQAGYDHARNRTVVIPDRYPSAVDLNGVHHVRSMEKAMLRGVVLMRDSSGSMALLPLVRDCDRLVADRGSVLSTKVEQDEYGNYVVWPRQDKGGYPRVLVPKFAVGRILGPCFIWTENAWDTETYLYAPDVPRMNQRNVVLATWMTPACSGRMVLLPTGEPDGYDFRWKYSGGANPPTLVPDIGAGIAWPPALNGFPVLLQKQLVCSRGPACRAFRPSR